MLEKVLDIDAFPPSFVVGVETRNYMENKIEA